MEQCMPDEPIVIIGLPRSGTSMVAGLFAKHGVFTGICKEADERNPKGFFEHVGFTKLVIERYGKGMVTHCQVAEPYDGFRDDILGLMVEDGYESGPWLVKHAQVFHKLWRDFRPRFVVVRRTTDSITRSVESVGWNPRAINKGQSILDKLCEKSNVVSVSSGKIVEGNYAEIIHAFEHCGLELDEDVMHKFIDPRLWRHGK